MPHSGDCEDCALLECGDALRKRVDRRRLLVSISARYMAELPLRPGTIVSTKQFTTPKAASQSFDPSPKYIPSPGMILRVRDGSPRARPYKPFFEISSDSLNEVETRAVLLAEAAEVRLQRLLELPTETSAELQKQLYFSPADLQLYYADWREKVAVNTWKLVKNLCYFKLVPGLLALHKAREQYQTAESDCIQCIRLLGQKQRQEDLFADTLRKIEQNKSALKELYRGKRPFIAGGAVRQQGGSSRGKGANPSQRPPKSLCKETEMSLRLKQEISMRMLLVAVLKAWSVYSAMAVSLKAEVECVDRRHRRVMGQFCIAQWSRYAELKQEERVALKVVRGEMALTKKQRLVVAWRDAISLPTRRSHFISKLKSVLTLRSAARVCLSWRSYALHRRGKRLALGVAVSFNARVAAVRVTQRWRAVVILSQTLKLRLRSLACGEQLAPSSEDIEAATVAEIVSGMQWQRESLASRRAAWKETKATFTANEQRFSLLTGTIARSQRTRLIGRWDHIGEHRSLREINARAISLIVPNSESLIPCFSVLKFTPSPVHVPQKAIDDPLKRSVHLKYAKQQRDFPKAIPIRKPPLPSKSITNSPNSAKPDSTETRPRQLSLLPSSLQQRVDQDTQKLIQSLHDLSHIPYSFYTYSAQSALRDRRLPLKVLLLERWRHVLKARLVTGWKQATLRRRLSVLLTIRYAVQLGKRFLSSLRRLPSRLQSEEALCTAMTQRRAFRNWSDYVSRSLDIPRKAQMRKALKAWSFFLIRKAEHLTQILHCEEHYCRTLQRKAICGLRDKALSARKPREFLMFLLLRRHFSAWLSLLRCEIRPA